MYALKRWPHRRCFITISQGATCSAEVKKSRFVAFAARVDSASAAVRYVQEHSDFKATHNCWGFRLADGSDRCSACQLRIAS